MVSHPETGSDSPIGSDRDRGRDKNRVGIDTGPSGTGTTAPYSLNFLHFYIIKPKFIHQ